jgi:nucleoside-diphosphate-sugar epimerase
MPRRKKTLVVTGATGFVGRHFVQRILREDTFHVRCLVRPHSDLSALEALGGDISFHHGDITREASLQPAFDGAWAVVNLAGYREFWSRSRAHFYQLNEHGAANVFRACLAAGVKKVVQVSTPLAYGVPAQIPFDEDSAPGEHPSHYARSKYRGDQAGWRLYEEQGLPLTIVYLAAVIGAGDDKSTMEVRRAVEKKLPALVGADTTYTYVYVRDAADAIARALLQQDSVGRRYLIGNQRATTRDYFNTIGRIADVPIPAWNIPESCLLPVAAGMEWLSRRTGVRPMLPLDVLKTTAAGSLLFDDSRAIEELGMRYTTLDTALAEAVAEIRCS